ncbi:MAG: 4Fe-4S dicluster domain-containing protein [Deltaproteobacteria bacterium]|nr:4Fe-4S dicluster domain-containing protein [Deltaproteobacteria bacterium]
MVPTSAPPAVIYDRFAPDRLKILKASGNRWHRYRAYRLLTMLGTLGLLFLVPLIGLARFDLYGGEHRALFEQVSTFTGLIAVGTAIFAFYFLTFQVNLVAGRMFCGWGCPVGQLNRLADSVQSAKGPHRILWWTALIAFALSLGGALLFWWSAPAVLLVFPYNLAALGVVLAIAGTAIVFARSIGWNFCKKACPIGLYYSVVQQQRPLGILYDEANCLDEEACVKACPVHLDPRDMKALRYEIGGLAIDGLDSHAHCLRCGECVEACDLVTSKVGPVALSFGRPPAPLERAPLVNADGLVQLPSRSDAPANDVLLPAQSEPEGPSLSPRDLFLSGGEAGLFGTGLSLLSVLITSGVGVAVLLLLPTPLWTIAQGSPVWPRFLASGLAMPVLAALALAGQRRLQVQKWAPATGLLVSILLLLGSTAYAVLAPGSGARYRPTQTWETPNKTVTKTNGYQPAASGFIAGEIAGRVIDARGPVAGAAVWIDHPGSGEPLPPARTHAISVVDGRWSADLYLAHSHDSFVLSNPTPQLHTFHLAAGGRTFKNVPLTPGSSAKQLSAIPPGEYDLSCDNHPTEKSLMVILTHPYATFSNDAGEYQLRNIPVGSIRLEVRASGSSAAVKLELEAGKVSHQEIRVGPGAGT